MSYDTAFDSWEYRDQRPLLASAIPVVPPVAPATPAPPPAAPVAAPIRYNAAYDALLQDPFKSDLLNLDALNTGDNIALAAPLMMRMNWDDYATRFRPFEDALIQQTHYANPDLVPDALTAGEQQVGSAIDLGQATQQRRLQAMGQYVSPEAQGRMDQTWGNQRALAQADAANRIRQNIAERSRNIVLGGTTAAKPNPTTTAGG